MKTTCFPTKMILILILAILGFAFIFKEDLNRLTDNDTRCK